MALFCPVCVSTRTKRLVQQTTKRPEAGTPAYAPALVLSEVTKTYVRDGRRIDALSNVSVEVPTGSIVGIVGRSGAGKSTLVRLVAGLLPFDSGSISVLGRTPDAARQQKLFAFMPQAPALLPWKSALENANTLASLNGLPASAGAKALQQVGLGRASERLPRQLSGGMQQRVALARTMALGAPVLLLDEPFSALDEVTREHMRSHIADLRVRNDVTILLVTHDISEAIEMCDEVIALGKNPGEVVAHEKTRGLSALTQDAEVALTYSGAVERLRTVLRDDE